VIDYKPKVNTLAEGDLRHQYMEKSLLKKWPFPTLRGADKSSKASLSA